MSKSMNMLRTRRRDNNVKPNRRLDRKSSRGMLYENEELRLKTININAEIERGQSDIKKLKRENEMLKKEIWCLRDEYEKLDKLIKEKQLDLYNSSSTSTCSSESDSCSSCSEESEEVETTQNIENVQKTNLKNLHVEFDHLSVVPEENSGENSDRNSNAERDVLKADQSYPAIVALPLPAADETNRAPKHFFSPIVAYDDDVEATERTLYPHQQYGAVFTNNNNVNLLQQQQQQQACKFTTFKPYQYQREAEEYASLRPQPDDLQEVPAIDKNSTDLIVKMDNYKFDAAHATHSQSTFSNGGNLEELLNDIECISQDILKLSNSQLAVGDGSDAKEPGGDKPFKSELNVVLMPTPMPLIGFEKYKNLSSESLSNGRAKSQADGSPSMSHQNLAEQQQQPNFLAPAYPPDHHRQPFKPLTPSMSTPVLPITTPAIGADVNPFFFGNFPATTPHHQNDYFNARYNPDAYFNDNNVHIDMQQQQVHNHHHHHHHRHPQQSLEKSENEICNSKCNLLDLTSSGEHVSSEVDEKSKAIAAPAAFKADEKPEAKTKSEPKRPDKPKLSIRRKVSIHFKGKKEKNKAKGEQKADEPAKKRFFHKAVESSKDDPKTPASGSDKKSSTSMTEQRSSTSDKNTSDKEKTSASSRDKKPCNKSASASPDRKAPPPSSQQQQQHHVHVKDEKKCHKKHKRLDRQRSRRSSSDRFHRERSFSVCTDRSNILDHRLGALGFPASSYCDEYSDRDRSNSLSSCDTVHRRKMSSISQFPVNGKIPWCGCWGNGCL